MNSTLNHSPSISSSFTPVPSVTTSSGGLVPPGRSTIGPLRVTVMMRLRPSLLGSMDEAADAGAAGDSTGRAAGGDDPGAGRPFDSRSGPFGAGGTGAAGGPAATSFGAPAGAAVPEGGVMPRGREMARRARLMARSNMPTRKK